MPRYKIAHIREQGVDLVIIPLDWTFGAKSSADQQLIVEELQARSASAGLRGTVVPVWENGGRMSFLAPPNWHPYFRSINLQFIAQNLNRELYW